MTIVDIKRLVVAIAPDQQLGDEMALVLNLAEGRRLEVTFVTVIADLVEFPEMIDAPVSAATILDAALVINNDKLDHLITQYAGVYPHIIFNKQVLTGSCYVKIIQAANQLNADMIVINANGGDKRYASQFGSTTRQLMRKSNIPLWTTPRDCSPAITSIVAAVDVASADADEEDQRFNRSIVSTAFQIARLSNVPLHVVYAWRNYAQTYLGGWSSHNKLAETTWVHEEKQKHLLNLQRLVDGLERPGDRVHIELVEGTAEQVLPEVVKAKAADLLVMGTICRTGIAGMFIGNTAESVLDAVDCSVLTLKPDNFVLPKFP